MLLPTPTRARTIAPERDDENEPAIPACACASVLVLDAPVPVATDVLLLDFSDHQRRRDS
jgi:hypothetical protein